MFELEAVMVFNSGWTRAEIQSLTYGELWNYIEVFYRLQTERDFNLFKAFCFYNAESSAVSQSSDKNAFNKYMRDLQNRKMSFKEDVNIDDQFEEQGFGK